MGNHLQNTSDNNHTSNLDSDGYVTWIQVWVGGAGACPSMIFVCFPQNFHSFKVSSSHTLAMSLSL